MRPHVAIVEALRGKLALRRISWPRLWVELERFTASSKPLALVFLLYDISSPCKIKETNLCLLW